MTRITSIEGNERESLKAVLPATWTHVRNLDILRIGFQMKLSGLDWRSEQELFSMLLRHGLLQREGYTVRRAP